MKRFLCCLLLLVLLGSLSGILLPVGAAQTQEFAIVAKSLSLKDGIRVNFKVSVPEGVDRSSVRLLVFKGTPADTSYTVGTAGATVLSASGTDSNGYEVFQYCGVAAKEMGKPLYARAYYEADGETVYTAPVRYSVVQYLDAQYNRVGASDTLRELVSSVRAYGAAAQAYFAEQGEEVGVSVSQPLATLTVTGGHFADGFTTVKTLVGERVVLVADKPAGKQFVAWQDANGECVGTTEALALTVSASNAYTAVYGEALTADVTLAAPLAAPAAPISEGRGVNLPLSYFSPTAADTLRVVAKSLSLKDGIRVNFKVAVPEGVDPATVGLLVFKGMPEGADYTQGAAGAALLASSGKDSNGYQVFQYCGLAAKEMGKTLYARAYYEADGEIVYSEPVRYSVVQYLDAQYNRAGASESFRTLIASIRTYGAAAQAYFAEQGEEVGVSVSMPLDTLTVTGGHFADGFTTVKVLRGESVTLIADTPEAKVTLGWLSADGTTQGLGATATLVANGSADYTSIVELAPTDGLSFTYDAASGYTVSGYSGSATAVVVPARYTDGVNPIAPVTAIKKDCFENNTTLAAISLPEGLLSIGSEAFHNCTALKSLYIPASLTSLGGSAFYGCSALTEVVFAEGSQLGGISTYTFKNCTALKSINIPKTVTSIGDQAFHTCKTLDITLDLPLLTVIGRNAFNGCTALRNVVLHEGLTTVGYMAFYKCSSLTEIDIPASVESFGDSLAEASVFTDCTSLKRVSFAAGSKLKVLGGYSFRGCTALTSVTLPEGLVSIGQQAFRNCTALTEFTIPASVTEIGVRVLEGNSKLATLTIPFVGATAGGSENTHLGYLFNAATYSANATKVPTSLKSVTVTGQCVFGANDFYGLTSLTVTALHSWGSTWHRGEDVHYKVCTRTDCSATTTPEAHIFKDSSCSVCGLVDNTLIFTKNSAGTAYTVTGYTGSKTAVTIPATYGGLPVTAIDASVFKGNTVIKSIIIGANVTAIPDYAFDGCTALQSVLIGPKVQSIGYRAFRACSVLASAVFDGTPALTKIGNEAFHKSGLTSFVIPATVTSLGQSVFHTCKSLKSVEFAQGFSMTALPDYLFRYCSALTSLVIPEGVTTLGKVTLADCAALKTLVLPSTLKTVNTTETGATFYKTTAVTNITAPIAMLPYIPTASLTSLSIVGSGTLGANAFTNCTTLKTLSIANTVTSVSSTAFAGCTAITDYTLPTWAFGVIDLSTVRRLTVNGGTSIAAKQFYECTSLTYLNIGPTVTSIGREAFEFCGALTTLSFSEGLKSIGYECFKDCAALTSVRIPASVTTIGDSIFYNCTSLARVTFGADAKLAAISGWCFRYCGKLDGIVLPAGITSIGESAFADCTALSAIHIPAKVTKISKNAFARCSSLASLTFASGSALKTVDEQAFLRCAAIPAAILPAGVTTLGKSAFYGCSSLGEIAIPATVTSVGDMAFKDCTALKSVYITDLAAWCNITFGSSDIYSAFAANPLLLADNLYLNGTRVTALTIPSGITQIKPYAFTGYVGLTTLTVPAGVTAIGDHAFSSCYALTSVTLPASLVTIGNDAFAYTQKLSTLTLASGSKLATIGDRAFDGCLSLTTLTLPATLKQVGSQAFYGTGLTRINITDLAAWCGIAFADAAANPMYTGGGLWLNGSKMTKLTVPAGVTAIGDYAFYNGDFTTVTIPASLTSVGRSAFAGCNSLGGVYITDLAKWCGIAFANTQANPLAVAGNLYLNNALVTKFPVPASVTAIGENAFYGIKNLTGVYITDLAKWCAIDFGNAYSNPLYANGNLYLNNALVSTLTVPATVTAISDYAFYHCTSLTKVSISSATVDIGANAFAGCSGIQTLTVAENTALGHIGSFAFADCAALKTVTLPANVAAVSHTAFTACNAISALTAPASVLGCLPKDSLATLVINGGDTLTESALTGAKKLTAVTVGQSIIRIEKNAFADCTALARVDVEDIGAWCAIDFGNAKANPLYYAGKLCHNGAEVVTLSLPSSVTAVSDYAFVGCTSLKTLTLSDSVTSIGLRSFADCAALTKVTFTTNLKRIAPYAFAGCTALTTVSGGGTGWHVYSIEEGINTSSALNATALTNTYCAYLWRRN